MSKFLVDVNLPRTVSLWLDSEFIFVVDIDNKMKDSEIWSYAKSNELTILTKDSDFSNRIIVSDPPPRIIHFKIGNLLLADFKRFIIDHWEEIKLRSRKNKLVTVYLDNIDVIE
jgi:predicted nuclease of predicted toxin-antitoxin system